MNETKTTLWFALAAVVLAALAWFATPKPITPNEFRDQGEPFYPAFTDPNDATTLEVVEFDSTTASAIPFKVTFKNGKWTIPSHHDYPADGKDRLAKTAAGVIDLKKDDFRSDNVADHEALGVIDPLDATGPLAGRGSRVTLRASDDHVLADFIIGKQVPGREGFRFVRLPDEKRVYAVRINLDLSTRFADWIKTDLLEVDKGNINKVILKDYSINERTRSLDQRDIITLTKSDASEWRADKMSSSQKVDSAKMADLLATLDELQIVGIRPKPEGLSASLKTSDAGASITQQDMYSLQDKGFFIARDGQLLSNEGELRFSTDLGVSYVLRFGEVAYGSGEELTAGTGEDQENASHAEKAAENRCLFVTAEFDPSLLKEPKKPSNLDFKNKPDSLLNDADRANRLAQSQYDAWQRMTESGKEKTAELNSRFADWYYVIPSMSFDKLHLKRKDIVVSKK